ncbi:hypothetical protein [Streptomyces sp. WAC01280]|uniref:hypothetical protein n=1 Tax=Streptomyces sp. WAC01280 TaxID=2487424 RepID=UPI000F77D009|nr:hypothetical protein [Streptomyces sp. WAC01280]RSS59845.1 hypothetical protein EF909_08275 [Streptomyces sp. WAC01280]
MNRKEAAALLGHCAAFDNRKPSEAAAIAWASALKDVPCDQDALDAVAAFYKTPPKDPDTKLWIQPHNVLTLRAKLRSARLENFQYEPIANETTAEYLARYRGQVQAIASGRFPAPTGRLQLEGGPHPNTQAGLEARGWQGSRTVPDEDATIPQPRLADTVRRPGPLGVVCPACSAELGRPCKGPVATAKHPLGKPLAKPHTARRRAAAGEPMVDPARLAAEEDRVREASRLALARIEAEQAEREAEAAAKQPSPSPVSESPAEQAIPDAEIVDEEPAGE